MPTNLIHGHAQSESLSQPVSVRGTGRPFLRLRIRLNSCLGLAWEATLGIAVVEEWQQCSGDVCMYVGPIFISQTLIHNLYNYTMLMKIIKCGRNIYPVQ